MSTPPRSILDRAFKYTNSANTDVSKTFARIRRAQQIAQQLRDEAERREPVRQLRKRA